MRAKVRPTRGNVAAPSQRSICTTMATWTTMGFAFTLVLVGVAARGAAVADEPEPAAGLRVPEGFRVELFADDSLAHDIYCMTTDARGRVVVAGRGYVKTLIDADGDGRAERAEVFSEIPRGGAHGLCFDGPNLLCTGDNSVLYLRDTDGDGRADGVPEVWASLKNPEHGANGIARGPDGWFYLVCGNDAGVTAELANAKQSPVTRPDCGAVVRFSPNGQRVEIVAHGFRNPYDADFDRYGRLFVVDSDGERDQYLPWYSPTRLFDVAWGQHHGWVQRGWQHSWNRPAVYFDSAPRLAELGRGSPTGAINYRHRQFPAEYRDGFFTCCWTLGRVYHVRLEPRDGSYAATPAIFLETTGEVGFAPVDLQVGVRGELYVAIGGRQTRGGVFRVTYQGTGEATSPPLENSSSPDDSVSLVDQVLTAPQPQAAWSRARWRPIALRLGTNAFAQAARDKGRGETERMRAVEVLAELAEGVPIELARELCESTPASIGSRAVRLLATDNWELDTLEWLLQIATAAPGDPDRARAAWETIGRLEPNRGLSLAALVAARRETRPRLRSAALWAVRQLDPDLAPLDATATIDERIAHRRLELARGEAAPSDATFALVREALTNDNSERRIGWRRMEVLRLAQLELGDVRSEPTEPPVYAGYVARRPEPDPPGAELVRFRSTLWQIFPTGDNEQDRELARLLGMLNAPLDESRRAADAPGYSSVWTDASRVEDDLHYLIVLSRLPGTRSPELRQAAARALAKLHGKMAAGGFVPSRNWPARVGEAFERLAQRDPELGPALVDLPEFGEAGHSLFASRLAEETRRAAARKLAVRAEQAADDDEALTPELIGVLDALPSSEALPLLRRHWSNFAVRDEIALALARRAEPADRPRLVESLSSVQANVVQQAAAALLKLSGPAGKLNASASDEELATALNALKQVSLAKEQEPARAALDSLLVAWTRAKLPTPGPDADQSARLRAWSAWLARERPAVTKLAERSGAGAGDWDAWTRRLAAIDWDRGDAERGKLVFEKRACARCHRASDRLGPDLAGAASRFSRLDLFAAIIDPAREVAPLYQTTQIVTRSGKIYQGLIVYESPEGTLIQTTPDDTVRITGDEIVSQRKSRSSLMPTGLLNSAADGELADLYSYLQTLRGKR